MKDGLRFGELLVLIESGQSESAAWLEHPVFTATIAPPVELEKGEQ